MIRHLAGALSLSIAPMMTAADSLRDVPRALDVFAGLSGFEDLAPDRFGPPDQPVPTELGVVMVSRIFRNVCLGIEEGAALDFVTPPGFAPVSGFVHYWGAEDAPDPDGGGIVLSATGFIDSDEAGGHPWVTLMEEDDGMTCRIDWKLATSPNEQTMTYMSDMLARWLPWEYALVLADRPDFTLNPAFSNVIEWDRPCGDRWCGMTALFSLGRGEIMISTALNISTIEGERP